MKRKTGNTVAGEFEKSDTRLNDEKHVLILYVAGMRPKSTLAIDNVRKFCETNLHGRYELKVNDLYQIPRLAKAEQIIATPTGLTRSAGMARRHWAMLDSFREVRPCARYG